MLRLAPSHTQIVILSLSLFGAPTKKFFSFVKLPFKLVDINFFKHFEHLRGIANILFREYALKLVLAY